MKALFKALAAFTLLVIPIISPAQEFIRGDLNDDGIVDFTDKCVLECRAYGQCYGPMVACIEYPVRCALALDINDDGSFGDFSDYFYLSNYLLGNGPEPPAPFPECGEDPTNPYPGGDCCGSADCCAAMGLSGDINADGHVNLTDILELITFVYEGHYSHPWHNINCDELGDVVDHGAINLLDILHLIDHVYFGAYGDPPNECPEIEE